MFRPVGSHTSSVYWRRRLVTAIALVLVALLAFLTYRVLASGGGGAGAAADPPGRHAGSTGTGRATTSTSSTVMTPSTPPSRKRSSSTTASSGSQSSTAASARCTPEQLRIKAVTDRRTFTVGSEPVLSLQVTNTGPEPCVQDVGDPQIVLRVYNGSSRVWGSHDCEIQPGVVDRTLRTGQPAQFSIRWSGLSSQPHCAGTRQRVGAGTYTLYASLGGHEGGATQFSMS